MAATDLYRITTPTRVWTMSGGDRPVKYASGPLGALELYVPTPMGRSGITIKNEITKANLDLRVPIGHELAKVLLGSWLEERIALTVFRQRETTAVIWKGRLVSTQPADEFLKMTFESIFTSMRRPGLRARFQKSCRHPLYGRGCNLDPEDFAHAATISAVNGRVVTVPEADLLADGFFTGGMVRASDGSLTYIVEHVGALLTLNRLSGPLAADFSLTGPGTATTIYPGCPHDFATCRDRFANGDNYGGFDYIPDKNPMGGISIV